MLTLEVPGLGRSYGLCVMADGNCLVSTLENKLKLLSPAGLLATLAGGNGEEDAILVDGQGPAARFRDPSGMTVDWAPTSWLQTAKTTPCAACPRPAR